MFATASTRQCCYTLGVAAVLFHFRMAFGRLVHDIPGTGGFHAAASDDVIMPISGDPADFFMTDQVWADELQSLVQWSALYTKPKKTQVMPRGAAAGLRFFQDDDATPQADLDAVSTRHDSVPELSPSFSLLQTNATSGGVEGAARNRTLQHTLAGPTPAAAPAGNESHSTGAPPAELLEPTLAMVPPALVSTGILSAFSVNVAAAFALMALMALVAGTASLLLYYACTKPSSAHSVAATASPVHAYVAGMQVAHKRQLEKHLPNSCSYDCSFSEPLSSARPLRFQVRVEGPLCGIALTSPLSESKCVLYSASASSPSHGGLNPMSVAFAADSQPFIVSLLDAPEVHIEVRGEDVSLFDMSEGFLAHSANFLSVPSNWQAFVLSHRFSATHHATPPSRLYNEDPILEFQECALNVGSIITCVGELRRKENGVLTLHPWLSHLGDAGPAEESFSTISQGSIPMPAPAGKAISGKLLASDKAALIVPPQDCGMLAKLWANAP